MGKSFFPQISFFDQYVNYIHSTAWPGSGSILNQVDTVYRRMKELGITHSVTMANSYSLNPSLNRGIKLLDRHLEWSSFLRINNTDAGGVFLKAQGQDSLLYPFQVGGEYNLSLHRDNNFGFGSTSGTSVWFMSPHNDLIPNWIDTNSVVGNNLKDNGVPEPRPYSRYASPSNTTSANPNYMLYGKISRMLFNNEHQHFLRLIARLENSNFHDTMPVFTVKIVIKSATDGTESAFDAKMNKGIDYYLYLNESIAAVDTISKTFRKRDFDGTNYSSLLVNDLRLNFRGYDPVGKVIELGVLYEDYIPVFIDKLYMYDSLFNIYYTNSGIYNSVKSVLDTIIAKSGNDYYESVYCDEPYLMNAKIRKDFTQYLKITTDQKMEINGAAGAYWKWHLLADREFGKQDFTNFYRHYLVYNNYPLHLTTPMGYERQDLLQQSFENMILYRNEGVIPDAYTDHYQHMGFFPSLLGSMNDTPILEDDIPLIQTIQVSAIRYIEESGGIAVYQDHPHNRRSPTREELGTMFNLALAYGAKGMMYYMVPTRIDPFRQINHPIQVNATIGTYGLFDNPGSGYQNLDNGNTAYQSTSSEQQNPNSRYFALRELINKTKPIEKFILRSHWINGYKADADTTKYRINNLPLSEWISSISSIVRGEEVEDEISYIEAGLFSYTTDPSQGIRSVIPDTLLIFIVNKFCDDTDSNETTKVRRNVKVKLNPLNLPYDNFSVINLSDSTYPIIAHLADSLLDSSRYFTLPLYGGEGNLIMITPTIYSGGEFRRAETIYKNETIKKTIHMKNHKLTIANGVSLEFHNASKLIVEDGQLNIGDSTNTNIVIDFRGKSWTAANGIFSYRSPVRINNVTVKNASCGLYSHVSPGDIIDGLKTENTHTGISLYYSYNYGVDNTIIRNSNFENCELWGITMVGSRPLIHDNTFHNDSRIGKGVNALTNSEPWLIKSNIEHGNNKFENINTSIYSLYSTPVLGSYNEWEYWGNNCFIDDSLSLHWIPGDEEEPTTMYAFGNFWQSEKPEEFRITIEGTGEVLYEGFTSVCSGELNKMAMTKSGNTNKTNSIEPDSIKTIFVQIQNLINTGELRLARELVNGLVSGETSTSCKKKAIRLLPHTFEEFEIQDLITELLRIRQTGNLFKATTMLLLNIDTQNMATYKQEIMNAGNNKMYGAGDNSEEVMMIYNTLLEEKYKSSGVIDTAGRVTPMLTYLNSNFPTSEYTKTANLLFSDLPENSPTNGVLSKQQPDDSKPESVIYEYKLFNNYPNPFNPETVVEYSVKEKSTVTLSIYDILGRKIYEVDQPGINSGRYEMRWEGTNKYGEKVSSGVYILEMRAKSLESSTEYRSSIKLLLTK